MTTDALNLPADSRLFVEVDGVSKSFTNDAGETVRALADVSLSVKEGEFVTIVGPTGCGKTTLLNLIAGLETPDEGAIRLAGGLTAGREVAYVFQHYTLFPWRSALGNVAFGPETAGVPRAERNAAARALLERVGLAGFEKSYPRELSGGMRQRVAIAQALATKPRLLLMDEPFGALDGWTRGELQQMLLSLGCESGAAILFVTHSIDEAVLLGDRVAVLSGRPGRVVREFAVNLPRPHDPKSEAFTDLFLKIRSCLFEESVR
jgi:ABC-type nitrate/sulfonate/bicarbonate transport system ATPase subunit